MGSWPLLIRQRSGQDPQREILRNASPVAWGVIEAELLLAGHTHTHPHQSHRYAYTSIDMDSHPFTPNFSHRSSRSESMALVPTDKVRRPVLGYQIAPQANIHLWKVWHLF